MKRGANPFTFFVVVELCLDFLTFFQECSKFVQALDIALCVLLCFVLISSVILHFFCVFGWCKTILNLRFVPEVTPCG